MRQPKCGPSLDITEVNLSGIPAGLDTSSVAPTAETLRTLQSIAPPPDLPAPRTRCRGHPLLVQARAGRARLAGQVATALLKEAPPDGDQGAGKVHLVGSVETGTADGAMVPTIPCGRIGQAGNDCRRQRHNFPHPAGLVSHLPLASALRSTSAFIEPIPEALIPNFQGQFPRPISKADFEG
jgi:hypothetical protein